MDIITQKPIYIYQLRDPRDGEIRYIGKAVDPVHRLRYHKWHNKSGHVGNWLEILRGLDLLPIMEIIEVSDAEAWAEREKYWIAFGREQGWKLTNITSGGEDGTFVRSRESIEKSAAALRGRKRPQEVMDRVYATKRARGWISPEGRARIAEYYRTRTVKTVWPQEVIDRRARSNIGKHSNPRPLRGITYCALIEILKLRELGLSCESIHRIMKEFHGADYSLRKIQRIYNNEQCRAIELDDITQWHRRYWK
jgi:hypothetical protein